MTEERKTLAEELFSPVSEEIKKKWEAQRLEKEREIGEIFPLKKSDPKLFREKFREIYAERLLETMTDPSISYLYKAGLVQETIERVRRGGKIKSDDFIDGALLVLGQDFRMTHDEIQQLREEYFE